MSSDEHRLLGGHTESLLEMDSLVAVAEQEAQRKLGTFATSDNTSRIAKKSN
jgi:hypothetical protein